MNVKMFGEICDAFGPSGFEEDVIRTVAKYCKGLELENDAMNNLYARMPGEDPEKPVVMLDAHTDECGFMVQSKRKSGDPHARRRDPHEPSGAHSDDPDQKRETCTGNYFFQADPFYE